MPWGAPVDVAGVGAADVGEFGCSIRGVALDKTAYQGAFLGSLRVILPHPIHEILRVRGKGVPMSKNKRGDLLIKLNIKLPAKLSKQARATIEELKKEGI